MKKILILLADVGNGHKSAANALTEAFQRKYPGEYEIKHLDLFEEADIEPFNTSNVTYSLVSKNRAVEGINNLLFGLVNTGVGYPFFKGYTLRMMLEESERLVMQENADIVISVHPIVSLILGGIKEKHQELKTVTVITDLKSDFKSWADTTANLVVSPTSESVNILVQLGVDIKKIIYPLFPINPKLSEYRSKETVCNELNLDKDKPVIVMTGGGLGAHMLENGFKRLTERDDIQVILIAGKLETLRNQLEQKYKGNKNVRILGFVNNIHDYFNCADIIIGKPGPASILEMMLFDKKAILTRRIGAQEKWNVEYALRNPKFRYIEENWNILNDTVNELLAFTPHEESNSQVRSFDECLKIVEAINNIV
jgi:UDP-N-acetylglucosamine:LPS N-acetylglucosamine transferase